MFSSRVKTIITIGAASFLVGILASANWTPPPASPPTCPISNPACNPPIHTGTQGQNKEGPLTLGAFGGPSGLRVLNGNVGIGIISPVSRLHSVVTNATSPFIAERSGANAVQFNVMVGGNDLGLYQKGNGAADGWTSGVDAGQGYKISNNLGFGVNDFLTILTSGNVGIGTAVPSHKLEVVGNTNSIANDPSTSLANFRLHGAGQVVTLSIFGYPNAPLSDPYIDDTIMLYAPEGGNTRNLQITAADPSGVIRFNTGGWRYANSERMRIVSNGNVGIGTTAPTRKLEVSGATTGIKVTDTDATGNAFVELSTVDGGSSYFQNITGRTKIRVGGADRMTFLNNGNVGIGTVNPSQMFEVFGGNIKLGSPLGVGAESRIVLQDENDYIYKLDQTNPFVAERFGIVMNLVERLTIANTGASGGGIGIGVTNPLEKLHVIGNILASGSITPSDKRMKDNVQPLSGALSNIDQLRGVSFLWNELSESQGHKKGTADIGVIAQEIEAVYPELVTTYGEEGYKAVDYSRLTAVLIEAVKELKTENEALKRRVEVLERE